MPPRPAILNRSLRVPLVLFFAALAVRLIVAWIWEFDGLYGQDAYAYFNQSAEIANRFSEGQWSIPRFFWPSGFPVLAALAMMIFGSAPATAQILNMVLGSLLVVVVYLLGRDLSALESEGETSPSDRVPEGVGFIAAATTLVAGQLVSSSVVVMADMAAAFWLTLSAWLLVRFAAFPERWNLVTAAAAAAAAAVVTRWGTVLAAPAFAVVTLAALRKCPRRRLAILTAVAAFGLVAFPQLVLSLSGRDGGLGGYFEGWTLANSFLSVYESDEGLTRYLLPNGVFYLAPWWHPAMMPPTMGVFALPGLIALWRRRRFVTAAFLGLWPAAPYLFFVGIPHQNLRYGITMWAPAVILAAIGVAELWQRPARRVLVAGLLAVSLVGSVAWSVSKFDRFFGGQNHVKEMARHLGDVLPEGAVILSFEATLALDHYTDLEVHELYSMDTADLEACIDRGNPIWVVVDEAKIETQWRDLSPWQNLMWLRTNRSLEVVERHGKWTVFAVRSTSDDRQILRESA